MELVKDSELSQPQYETIHEKNVEIPMRDGTTLRANITRPNADGQFPALLERTPYNKEGGSENTVGAPEYYASRGYVVIIQDVRGRFASDGEFYPFRDDGAGTNRDGYDTVEWLAAQPWSDGNVGTIGGSYSGATQYRNALSRPPHLRAMFIRESSADYYHEWVYRGGAFELGFNMGWARAVTLANLAHLAEGDDLARHQGILEGVNAASDDWHGRLPISPTPYMTGLSDWYNEWLDNPTDGPYWWQFNIEKFHDQIETPMYHLGGWFDVFLNGTLKNYMGLKKQARTEKARKSQRLIVGPWIHGPANIDNRFAGEFDYGPDAALKINDLRLPWFDHWLKGAQTGIMDDAPVRIFVMGRNKWTDREDWPIPGTQYTKFYLHGGTSGSASSLNDGTLSTEPPQGAENPDSYTYDPANPVPSKGGNTLTIPNGAYDQRDVEERCLTFTSEPLTEEIEATGHVTAVLYAASSARDTDWVVRITDVHPDGYSRPVADGILRARYRDSFENPTLLSPGQIYEYDIDLWATSNAFLPGHRIRVTITSSCFPRFDRNLNTGGPIHKEAIGQVAINTVFHDELRPSHVVLPMVSR
jgi:putative CocE/NonD family hydrolase